MPRLLSRRYTLLLIATALVTALLAVLVDAVGLIGVVALVAAYWLTLLVGAAWLLVKGLNRVGLMRRSFRLATPLKGILLLVVAALSAQLVANTIYPPALPASAESPEVELAYIHDTDQSDRFAMRLLVMGARDGDRLARVWALHEQGRITTPRAHYDAALVLQHGSVPADYELAHELATVAAEGGVEEAGWLSKATYDRWQLSLGRPQRYGTQSEATLTLFGLSVEQR